MGDQETLNVVILGASYAGIAAAHRIYSHVLPQLDSLGKGLKYRILLVSPSNHFYFNVAAPRELASPPETSLEQWFSAIKPAFDHYDAEKFQFIQGTAVGLDTYSCTLSVECPLPDWMVARNSDPGRKRRSRSLRSSKSFSRPLNSPTDEDDAPSTRPRSTERPNRRSKSFAVSNRSSMKVESSPQRSSRDSALPSLEENRRLVRIRYQALVICTGSKTPSPLHSIHGPHTLSIDAIKEFQWRLPKAETIVVAGGGCTAIETASQVAYYHNFIHPPQGPVMRLLEALNLQRPIRSRQGKKIVLLCGDDRLLAHKRSKKWQAIAKKSERQLQKLGIKIFYGMKVCAVHRVSATERTTLKLSDGAHIVCELYVPCTGVEINNDWLPTTGSLVSWRGGIPTEGEKGKWSTLRVPLNTSLTPKNTMFVQYEEGATDSTQSLGEKSDVLKGEERVGFARIYAIGDCADYSRRMLYDVYAALPVLEHNLLLDLKVYELAKEGPKNDMQILELQKKLSAFKLLPEDEGTQLIPIGNMWPGGVGTVAGLSLPSILVWLFKGRDYRLKEVASVMQGKSPYPKQGGKRNMAIRSSLLRHDFTLG